MTDTYKYVPVVQGDFVEEVRVLNVLGSLDVGGTEVRLLGLIPTLHAANIQHDIICLSGRKGALADKFEAHGCAVYPIALRIGAIPSIYRIMRNGNYAFVHSRVATFSGFVLLIAVLAGVRGRIAHFHSDADEHGGGVRRRVQRFFGRVLIGCFATHVLAVSPTALEFSGVRPGRTRKFVALIPGGVDETEIQAAAGGATDEQEGVRVANVGRPATSKRRELAAEVVALCGPSFSVDFIGKDGPDLERVRRHSALSGRPVPNCLGVQDNVRSLLREYHLLLSTSSVEGLPGVVLEALSVGTPVVATRLSGSEWIAEHVRGLILVDADAPISDWVDAVVAASTVSARDRSAIADDFASSPFTSSAASTALISIYGSNR